jgi:hypothetical protein
MPVYSDLVTGLAIGAASTDTFGAVGTVTMRPEPGTIIGFWDNGTANANTAAEAYQYQVNYDLGQLGKTFALITGGCSVGEAVATQSSGHAGAAQLTPANIPFKGNEDIPITAAHHGPAPTAGLNVQAGVLYTTNRDPPPAEWYTRFPNLSPIVGSDSEANAAVTAASTAITDLEIPAHARHINGYRCTAAQDAAGRTAEDLLVSIIFTSTIPDFTPQEYPFVWKYPNLAGTLVGQGIAFPVVTWPAWMPTHGVNQTVTPTATLATAVTDAHSITADVFYTEA